MDRTHDRMTGTKGRGVVCVCWGVWWGGKVGE